jgi:hypothetical protein
MNITVGRQSLMTITVGKQAIAEASSITSGRKIS